MIARRRIEELKRELEARGLRARMAYSPECTELTIEDGGSGFTAFAFVYPGRFTQALVVKLTAKPRTCRDALYDPEGLIAIAEDVSVLADKIKAKLERLKAIEKIAKRI